MSFFVLLIEVFISLSISGYLLYSYGNISKQNPFVTLCCLLVWFFSLIVVFLLPLDISSSFTNLCLSSNISNLSCHLSYSYISPEPIRVLWYILYWSLQLLSWVILPIFQSYVSIHYFSIWKRIAWSLAQNGIVYLSLGFISLIIMLFLIIKEGWNFNNIISMAVTASNVWVLFFLILLLGYGLVEVPRFLFKLGSYNSYLKYLYFETAKTYFEKVEAEVEIQEVVNELKSITINLNSNDCRLKKVKIILSRLPTFLQSRFKETQASPVDIKNESITLYRLEKLHDKSIRTTRKLIQNTVYLSNLISKTISLENVVTSTSNIRRLKDDNMQDSTTKKQLFCISLNWVWRVYILRGLLIIFFVCSIFLSSVIFISEITIFLNQFAKVSLLSYFINVSSLTNEYVTSELFCVIILGYIALCSYYSVFQIRIFNKYRLVPHHNSNEFSLIFSAILLSRLIISMCLNFLYMVDLARLPGTSSRNLEIKPTFFDIWSSTVPEIAVFFFIYFPLVIILVVLSTIFHLDKRILSFLGFQQFIGDADLTSELVLEGKEFIKLERKALSKSVISKKNHIDSDINQDMKRSNSSNNKNYFQSNITPFRSDIFSNLFSFLSRRTNTSTLIKYSPLDLNGTDDFSQNETAQTKAEYDKIDRKEITVFSDNVYNEIKSYRVEDPKREIFWDI